MGTPIQQPLPQVETQTTPNTQLPTSPLSPTGLTAPTSPLPTAGNMYSIQPLQEPATADQVQPYLNDAQSQNFAQEQQATSPFEGDPAAQALSKKITSGIGTMPEAPKLVDLYTGMREEKGLKDIEESLRTLEAQKEETFARLRGRSRLEKGKAVALNVMQGRISEAEVQERENMDFIDRQINVKTNQLRAANEVISTMVSLTGQDFENASKVYNQKFAQNMQIYQTFRQEQKEERDFQQRLKEREQDVAKSNIQMWVDLLKSGNLNFGNLSESTKIEIGKLESQAGLPQGFVSNIKIAPSETVKSITTRVDQSGNKYADILKIDQNGKMYVESQLLGKEYIARSGGGGSSAAAQKAAAQQKSYNGAIAAANQMFNQKGLTYHFPQLVTRYASQLDLADIYDAYMASQAGKTWGYPKEPATKIRELYNKSRG